MTAPYPFLPKQTYLIGRRVELGRFQLIPTREVVNALKYLAILYAKRHGIEILACCIMSNHYHMVVFDQFGGLADFQRDFHARLREVILALNGLPGQRRLWEQERAGRTRLEDTDAVRRMIIYTCANPVRAGLTRRGHRWEGLIVSPAKAGQTLTATRPPELDLYTSFPGELSYVVPRCRAFPNATFHQALCRDEDKAHKERDERPYFGNRAALAMPASTLPKRPLPHTPNPLFASKNEETRKLAVQTLRAFRAAHRATRKLFMTDRSISWPPGTYAMHHWHGCPRLASG